MISKNEISFAARLVHLGLVSKEDMQAVLRDLSRQRDSRLDSSLDEILVERGHVTKTEIPLIKEEDRSVPVSVSGYRIGRVLGEGGMSRVFRAVPSGGRAPVALKILRPHLSRDPLQLRRFYHEAELLIRFEHPNLVKGEAVFESDGLHCFAMELVDGRSIQEEIESGTRFDEHAALDVIVQAARALVYLAGEGVTHRDVKPGNLLRRQDGVVKLIDLGLALDRAAEADQRPGTTVGTVQYVSPEQAKGEALDARADIYSLGVSLYHMVMGEVPFRGETDRDVLRQQVHATLRSPRAKDRSVTPQLHYFIEKMMAKDRELRYADPSALITDIERKIAGLRDLTAGRPEGEAESPGSRAQGAGRGRPSRFRRRGRFGR